MTALALRDDQTQWDAQQIAVLEAGGIDGDVSDAELAAFLHECQRRKLDPFTRQIYLIGRFDNRKGRKVYRSQTSIDGFRLIARRAADKSGIDYSYEDTIWFDESGQRHEIWLSPKPPAGAKVVVIRNGSRFDAVARFGAYVQMDRNGNPSGQWRNMADVMVAKCAEALALRKAFPEDLGGIYTEEEMAQADNPQRVTATAEVVRDEPAQQAPSADQEWLSAAFEAAPNHATLDACTVMWRKSAEKVRDQSISKEDAIRLQAILRTRMETLKAEAEATAPAALDADDPWSEKIADLTSEEEAASALDEATELMASQQMEPGHFARVETAILARFPAADKPAAKEAA